jgi:hypothetical protein
VVFEGVFVFLGCIAITALVGLPASAQILGGPAQLTPANPTAADIITALLTVQVPGACEGEATSLIDGTVIRTTIVFGECAVTQPFTLEVFQEFGPLPANTYTYEIYVATAIEPPTLRSTQTFQVAAASVAAVPSLSQLGAAVLALALAAAAVAVVGRSVA